MRLVIPEIMAGDAIANSDEGRGIFGPAAAVEIVDAVVAGVARLVRVADDDTVETATPRFFDGAALEGVDGSREAFTLSLEKPREAMGAVDRLSGLVANIGGGDQPG